MLRCNCVIVVKANGRYCCFDVVQDAIDTTMVMFTCGMCEVEHGTASMTLIDDELKARITRSGVPAQYQLMIAPCSDDEASIYEKVYAAEVVRCLDELGLRRGAKYVCNQCNKALPQKLKVPKNQRTVTIGEISIALFPAEETLPVVDAEPNKADDHKIPKYALVNGLFRGEPPPQLTCLNRTELSLVNLIDVVATITPLPTSEHWCGSHYGGNAK